MTKIIIKNKQGKDIEIGYYKQVRNNDGSFTVYGQYNTSLAPNGGGGDAIHSFQNRVSDNFGGRMNDAIQQCLKQLYNEKVNPMVKDLFIRVTGDKKLVNWSCTICESDDGLAYVGFNSRGGASGKTETKQQLDTRVQAQVLGKQRNLPTELKEKFTNIEFREVLDYYDPTLSGKSGIRQIFFQYTRPKSYPKH